jgi:hypothetical protein
MKDSFLLLMISGRSQNQLSFYRAFVIIFFSLLYSISSTSLNSQVPIMLIDFFVPPGFNHQQAMVATPRQPNHQSHQLPRDLEIARVYLRSAVQSHNQGDSAHLEKFLASVFEYDQHLSDGWYLSAYVALERGFPSIAVDLLHNSLAINRFIYFSYEQVETLYIATLYRLQRYTQIVDHFYISGSSNPATAFRMVHPDQVYYLLNSIDRTGRRSTFPHAFRQALISFPDDPRIQVLQSPLGLPPSLRIEQFLQLSPINQQRHLSALELFVDRLDQGENRRQWIQQYIQYGGSPSNRMLRLYLEDTRTDEQRLPVTMNDLLFQGSFHDIYEASRIYQLLATTQFQSTFVNFFLSQGREFFLYDRNGDGYPQEWFQLDQGMLTKWQADHDQDNFINHTISFIEGVPQVYTFQNQSGLWIFNYNKYPFLNYVDHVPFQQNQDTSSNFYYLIRYYLRPLEMEFEIINTSIPLGLELRFPRVFIELASNHAERFVFVTNHLERESYRIERIIGQQPFLEARFSPYQIIVREDFDRTGNHERYIIDFPDSGLTLEFFDIDEDGWYEYILIHGVPGIYYRPQDAQGLMVNYDSIQPGVLTLTQQDLIHRYQNILFFRGQSQ